MIIKMKKKSKIFSWFIVMIVWIMNLTGCANQKKEVVDMSLYDTPYTKCIENEDGTYSFFVYSAPVQYKEGGEYQDIDMSLVDSKDPEYAFENKASNIKTYYPVKLNEEFTIKDTKGSFDIQFVNISDEFTEGKLERYTNIYGDEVQAVSYQNIEEGTTVYVYSTYTGIRVEYQCKDRLYQPKIIVKTQANSYREEKNGYIVLKRGDDKEIVIHDPVIKNNEKLSWKGKFSCIHKSNGYHLTMNLDEKQVNSKEIKVEFSIDRYVNKIPDTNICSKSMVNAYLKNYAIIGNHMDYGECWNYLRFRIKYFIDTDPDNIIDAKYYTKCLYGKKNLRELKMYTNVDQWSSTMMTWNDKLPIDEKRKVLCSEAKGVDNNWICFNMKRFVKECVEDIEWLTESMGCRMVQENNDYTAIASSENSLYVPYLEIVLSELPESFRKIDIINQELTEEISSRQ